MANQNAATAAPVLAGGETGLLDSLRALPRAAWVLYSGIFLNRFGTFVIPFLTLYMKRKGYSLADTGIAVGSYGAGTLLACFFGGNLADQIGRRKTIALSMFGGAATMLLLSIADSWWTIVLFIGLNGLCGELYRPASSALLADLVPNGQRVIAFSGYRMALNAGWAFGPATAGFLADYSFKWLFIGDAFTSTLFGIIAWTALPHGVRAQKHESGWTTAVGSIRQNRAFLQLLLASMFIAWIFYQMSSTYSLFISQLGYSPAVYGALISLNGAVVVCFELIISNFTRRFDPRRPMALGYLLVGIGFGLNAFATGIPTLIAAIFIFTFGEMMSIPVSAAYIADIAPTHMRGRYMGAHGLSWGITFIFGPGLGMWLLSQGSGWLWGGCALSGLLGAAIISLPQKKANAL
ncbi:MAG TPA: MFS transporter [Verrucomicrobiae bacterium]|nr:MFS transporter [Verrucomicrobiae bacterium]